MDELYKVRLQMSQDSANPDHEIVATVRPAMARVPGALLLAIRSPYARRGVLWDAYRHHDGRDGDPVLVWQAETAGMNPAVDPDVIAEAYARDEADGGGRVWREFRRELAGPPSAAVAAAEHRADVGGQATACNTSFSSRAR